MAEYVATVGLDYEIGGKPARAEPGDSVPAALIKASPWLIERGHVVKSGAPALGDDRSDDG